METPCDERVLVLMPTARDSERTVLALAEAGLVGVACADISEVCLEIERGAGAVLIAEEAVTADSQGRLAGVLKDQPPWSDFPLVVLAREWAAAAPIREVMNATLIERPLKIRSMLSVVRAALRSRRRQYQVRDHLAERRRAEEAQDYLVKLADTLRPLSNPEAVQAAANRSLGEHLGANRVLYFEISGPDYVVEHDYANGVESLAGRYPVASFGSALLDAFLAGQTVVEADATILPTRAPAERAAFAAIGVRGHVDVPLVKAGGLVAGMTVHSSSAREWSAEDVTLIEQTAERTWAAVERARAGRAIRAGEERFRSLFESMAEGYCVVEPLFDADGRPVDYRYLLANPALEQHTGLNGIVGKTAREIMPGHESHWIEAYSRVAATGEAIRRTDQAADLGRWFDVSAFPVGVGQVGVLFADVTARRAAEEELRASEARLSEIFRHAPSFMCVLSGPDHVFERVNDRYHQLVGHRDILGKPVLEAIPEVEGQGFVELLDGVYRTGDPFVGKDLPIRLQRVPGGPPEERYLDFVYQAVRDSDGQITGIFVQGIDLTDRKRAEEELRSKTERLNLLVENIKDYAVVIFDPEGLILEWQGGAERITGYAQDEAIGQRAGLLFTPQDLEIGLPQLEMSKAAETGRAEDKRWHLKKDGTRFYADGVMTALYTEDGKLRGFGKVFKDATADKLDEESTRRRAMKLQKLAGISLRISAAQDIDSVMSIVTEEARHLIGAHQSVTGFTVDANWAEAINHVSLSEKYAAWKSYNTRPDGSGIYSVVCRLNRPMRMTQAELEQHQAWKNFGGAADNHPPMRGWLAAPLTARDGGNLGLIQLSDKFEGEFTEEDEAILVQLAQLSSVAIANARLYQELRVNDEKKNEFLAMLAHELRNPLAAIANAVKLAATTSDQSHMDWSMGVITRQMIHLSRLIDDLMDVSRITRGKIELRRDVMDLTPILKSAAATVMTLVEERKHSLQLDIEGETLWADVDPTRLEQVVVNLLNNAAKYSDNAGHILLSARGEGSEIVVSIKDKGVGIPPDKLPEMFELFAQGDRSLARSEGGLGIGLTVVKKLVEMHGGIIVAKSDGPGKGSEFTIRLPAVAKPREGSSDPSSPEARKIKMARILVVDDNVDTARGMARLLKILGHEVATAHNGFEAIHLARSTSPDFILLDIGLPGMSGYEVAAQLRREECCRGAVIVAVSGYGQEEDRRRSKQAGFDFHLVKPLDHDALLALLAGSGRA